MHNKKYWKSILFNITLLLILFIFSSNVQAVEIQYITPEETRELLESRENGEILSTKNIVDIYNALQKYKDNELKEENRKYGNQIVADIDKLKIQKLLKYLNDEGRDYAYIGEAPDIKVDSNTTDNEIISYAEIITEYVRGKDGTIFKENVSNLSKVKRKNYMETLKKAYKIDAQGRYGDAYSALGGNISDLETGPSKKPNTTQQQPSTNTNASTNSSTDFISGAQGFIDVGKGSSPISKQAMKKSSDFIFNTLVALGTAIATIMSLYLAIKFITGSVEEQAKIKETIIPFVIGCILIFGAFGIWRLVLTLTKGIDDADVVSKIQYTNIQKI